MIVADEVQKAVECKDAQLGLKGMALFAGLTGGDGARNDNVPKDGGSAGSTGSPRSVIGGERQNVGDLVNGAKLAIEFPDARVGDQRNGERAARLRGRDRAKPSRQAAVADRAAAPVGDVDEQFIIGVFHSG